MPVVVEEKTPRADSRAASVISRVTNVHAQTRLAQSSSTQKHRTVWPSPRCTFLRGAPALVGEIHLGVHRRRPSRDFDNDGVNVDKVDSPTRKAQRRAPTPSRLATRGPLSRPHHPRPGPSHAAPHRALARRAHPARLPALCQGAEAAADRRRRRSHGQVARRRGRAVCAHAPRARARQDRGDPADRGRAGSLVDRAHGCAAEGYAGLGGAHAGCAPGRVGDSKIPAGRSGCKFWALEEWAGVGKLIVVARQLTRLKFG